MTTDTERENLLSLAWAVKETCLRLPMALLWDWRPHPPQPREGLAQARGRGGGRAADQVG